MQRSPLVVIFITIFLDLVGFGIVIPVLPFYAESEQFNAGPRAIGLLFASYSVMQLIFTPVLGRLSDKYGRRPVLFLSLIGTGLSFLLMGFATTLWMLFAGRILDGITGGNISTAQAYIADITTPENRARGMGMVGAAFGLGFIFGPAIGGIMSQWGIGVPFFFAAALSFANAVLLYFFLPETLTPERRARAGQTRAWSEIGRQLARPRLSLVMALYFLFVIAFSIMTATFALFTMYRYDFNARDNGYLFAFIGLVAVVTQGGLIGRLVKLWGEMPLIIMGALIFTAGLTATPFIGPQAGGLMALLVVVAVFSLGNSLATPSLTGLASKSASEREQGSILGVVQSVTSLARVVGPVLGAFLLHSATAPAQMDDRSVLVTYWTAAAVMLAASALAVWLARMTVAEVRGRRSEVS